MEHPKYTVNTQVSEEQLREGIRSGQRRWAAAVFGVICAGAVIFGIANIILADSFEDMYTWIVCILVGAVAAYPAFTAGKKQEDSICRETLSRMGGDSLRQNVRFYNDRLVCSEKGTKDLCIPYEQVQRIAELETLVTVIAGGRARVFLNRDSLPDGLTDFLNEKLREQGET